MKAEIDLVDIGIGNLGSVKRCLQRLSVSYRTVNCTNQPDGNRPILLPGVGQFGAVMRVLKENQFDACLRGLILAGTPYLGICIGLQILFDRSEEASQSPGLGILRGDVVRFRQGKVPHIGWNLIKPSSVYQGSAYKDSQYVYFVNSYYPEPQVESLVTCSSNYFGEFCAAVKFNNITAVQFHPEKSGEFGTQFIKEWLNDAC
jgi:glutamine amidotransferase